MNLEAVLTITSHPIKTYPSERSYEAEVPITEQLPHHHKLHRHCQECYLCIPSCNTAQVSPLLNLCQIQCRMASIEICITSNNKKLCPPSLDILANILSPGKVSIWLNGLQTTQLKRGDAWKRAARRGRSVPSRSKALYPGSRKATLSKGANRDDIPPAVSHSRLSRWGGSTPPSPTNRKEQGFGLSEDQ